MKLCAAATLLIITLVVSACATQWSRPDTTEQQTARDLEACENRAKDEFPISMSATLPSYQSQNSIGCAAGGDCRAKPGSTLGEANKDLNRKPRAEAVIACMETKGYSL